MSIFSLIIIIFTLLISVFSWIFPANVYIEKQQDNNGKKTDNKYLEQYLAKEKELEMMKIKWEETKKYLSKNASYPTVWLDDGFTEIWENEFVLRKIELEKKKKRTGEIMCDGALCSWGIGRSVHYYLNKKHIAVVVGFDDDERISSLYSFFSNKSQQSISIKTIHLLFNGKCSLVPLKNGVIVRTDHDEDLIYGLFSVIDYEKLLKLVYHKNIHSIILSPLICTVKG